MIPVFQCHRTWFYNTAHGTIRTAVRLLNLKQNIQCIMLHIGKVNYLLLLLFLPHTFMKIQHQIYQCGHRFPACRPLSGRKLQRRCEETLLQLLKRFLYFRPHRFRQFPFDRGYTFILFRRQPVKTDS